MWLRLEVPDSTKQVILNVIYVRDDGEADMVSGFYSDPDEDDEIDMKVRKTLN